MFSELLVNVVNMLYIYKIQFVKYYINTILDYSKIIRLIGNSEFIVTGYKRSINQRLSLCMSNGS